MDDPINDYRTEKIGANGVGFVINFPGHARATINYLFAKFEAN